MTAFSVKIVIFVADNLVKIQLEIVWHLFQAFS